MSKLIESRADFQDMADERLGKAKALLDSGKWSGAYYLAGYAVELPLKTCIIRTLMAADAFPDRDFSKNCYTHAIEKLVVLARLDEIRRTAMAEDPALQANWARTRDWSEEKRYHRIEKAEAEALTSPSPTKPTGCFHG